MFTSDKKRMGQFASPLYLTVVSYAVCVIIASLNVKLLWDTAHDPTKTGTWGVPAFWGIALTMVLFSAYVIFVYKDKREPVSPYAPGTDSPIKEGDGA